MADLFARLTPEELRRAAAIAREQAQPAAPAPQGSLFDRLSPEEKRTAAQIARGDRAKDQVRDDTIADLQQSDGFIDSAGDFLQRGRYQFEAGADRLVGTIANKVGATGIGTAQLDAARRKEAVAATPIAGEVGWEATKKDPLRNALPFMAQTTAEALPAMAVVATGIGGAGIYAGSQAGSIGQTRALNDGRQEATLGDIAAAAPAAIASAALERTGLQAIVGAAGKNVATRVAKAGAYEAVTEAQQSAVEYAGGTVGTKKGFDAAEALDQAAAGAVGGVGMGVSMRGAGEAGTGALRIAGSRLSGRPVAPGVRETAVVEAATPTQADIDSPLPTETVTAGRATMAAATASNGADEILRAAGMPATTTRVDVKMPDGSTRAGIVRDAFVTDAGEAGTSPGIKIELDDGAMFEEHFDTLADAGVSIVPAPVSEMTAEADAIDARLAANAAAVPTPVAASAVAEVPAERSPSPAGTSSPSPVRLPIQGRITSPFGQRGAPKAGASTNHGGIDIAAAVGTAVQAPAAGRVLAVGSNAKSGNFVRIDHGNGVTTSYAHLEGADVKVGDPVEAGQAFARSGNTGNTTGPHLHYVVRKGAKAVDPMTLGALLGGAATPAAAEAPSVSAVPQAIEGGAVAAPTTSPIAEPEAAADQDTPTPSPVTAADAFTPPSETGLAEIGTGMADAMSAGLIDMYVEQARAGSVNNKAGATDPALQVIKAIPNGANLDRSAIETIVREVDQVPAGDDRQASLRGIVAKYSPAPAPAATPVPATPASSAVQVADQSSGKSVGITGATEAQLARVAAAIPKAKAIVNAKTGAVVYSKKYEAKIREALAVNEPAAPVAPEAMPVRQVRDLSRDDGRYAVNSGEILTTVSGRLTSPAPRFNDATSQTRSRSLAEQEKWLLSEAISEASVAGSSNRNALPFLRGMTPGNMSMSDHYTVNDVLFGNGDGPKDRAPWSEDRPPSAAVRKPRVPDRSVAVVIDPAKGTVTTRPAGNQSRSVDTPAPASQDAASPVAPSPEPAVATTTTPPAPPSPVYGSTNKLVSVDRAAELREKLRKKMSQLNSGIDPEALAMFTELGVFHIEAGARRFTDWAKVVVADLGVSFAKARPFLRSAYNGARDMMEDMGASVVGMDGPEEVATSMRTFGEWASDAPAETVTEPITPAEPVSNPDELPRLFRDRFLSGESFRTITDARRVVERETGERVESGTARAKQVDEAIEAGVVQAARVIAAREGPAIDTYRALVDLYRRQPSLNVRTSTSIEQQAYSTPVPLAFLASRRAGIGQTSTVYEPSAGNGALLIDARATYVTANELNPDRAAALRAAYPGATITEGDAMTARPAEPVDAVIANPPFGPIKGDDGANRVFEMGRGYDTREIDHAISLRALESMKADGKAVLIVGSIPKTVTTDDGRSNAYNAKAKREFYLRLYNDYNVTDHFTVAGELYSRQGAGWPVDVIVIDGKGKSALRVPAADVPRQYASWDALEDTLEGRPSNARPAGAAAGTRAATPVADRPVSDDAGRDGGGRGQRPDTRPERGADQQPAADAGRPVAREPVGTGLDAAANGINADRPADRPGRTDRPAKIARPATPIEGENARQVAYSAASSSGTLGTLVPVNMQTATRQALDNLQSRVGAVDAFVADRLGYDPAKLSDALAAEQIDALALAIDNMERGAGFIIGDQTGIGKGRVVAGVIRYALKSGRRPIFVTEKPNLYADMYRDLNDIGVPDMLGRPVNILMTNAAQTVPLDDTGENVLKTPAASKHNAALMAVANGGGEQDVIFTTYSQMQSFKGETTERQAVLRAMAPGSIVVFDESHNAGGQGPAKKPGKGKEGEDVKAGAPNRAQFARELAAAAHGVFYSSATYAKRPDVMDLYATTDMRLAVADIDKLGEAISKGGIPMQQVVAANLAEAGQYVRRERSFDGITYDTPTVPVDRESYSRFTEALQAIQAFSEQHVATAVKDIDRDVKAEGKAITGDGSTGGAGASSTNFTAIMHNLIDQLLLSVKATPAATKAIEQMRAGKKVVLTVSNTMASFMDEYASENGINPGDAIELDFRALLQRYLERTRILSIRKPFSKEKAVRHRLTDGELGGDGALAFRDAMQMIDKLDISDLPISPIDAMRAQIEAAGFKVGEITGRSAMLDYSKPGAIVFRRRSTADSSIAGRRRAISGFNGGTIDAMILNQAGSTGLSLHASKAFKDKKPRHMIVVQAEKNIDTHMQMLGRVHRSGQVVLPSYDQLTADVPAEKRPTAILAKKMASLNANTTGARDSALTSEEVPDFINDYGDEIAARMMEEDPDLHARLTAPLAEVENGEGLVREGAARKVTGRLVLLPLDQQEAFYETFLSEFRDYLAQKEAAGESAMEARTLELDARTVSTTQVVAPTRAGSPFGEAVNVEVINAKRLGRPFTAAQVLDQIVEATGARMPGADLPSQRLTILADTGKRASQEMAREAGQRFADYRRGVEDNISDGARLKRITDAHTAQQQRFTAINNIAYPGATVRVESEATVLYGVVTKIERKGTAKNPLALGTYRVTIALADASRQIVVPMSQLTTDKAGIKTGLLLIQNRATIGETPMLDAFEGMQREAREQRTVITGNILAGFDHVGGKGQIVNFVDDAGDMRQGILMPRDFDYAKSQATRDVEFRTNDQVVEWVQNGNVASAQGVSVSISGGQVLVTTPAAKSTGGAVFLNNAVRLAMGGDFVKAGNNMRASAPIARLNEIVRALREDAKAKFVAQTELEAARDLVRQGAKLSRFGGPGASSVSAADLAAARIDMQARLNALGLGGKVGLQVFDRIDSEGRVAGLYTNGLIAVALSSNRDAGATLNHEVIHAMRDMGLFRSVEWTSLANAAVADKPMMARIRRMYPELDTDGHIEEAVAERYARWAAGGREAGFAKVAFERIREVLLAIGAALRGAGFTTAESVMRAIEAGRIGARDTVGTPNGVTREQRAAIMENPAFARWFGVSKIVDAEGNPKVMYHGTTADFDAFELGYSGSNTGASGAELAIFFAASNAETGHYIGLAQARAEDRYEDVPEGRVISAYIRAENPLILSPFEGDSDLDPDIAADLLESDGDAIRYAQNNGYDAVWWLYGNATNADETIAVLSPDQIKSVDNNGAFDLDDPRIRFSLTNPDVHAFENEETEKRFQEATKGLGTGDGWITNLKLALGTFSDRMTRHWVALPNLPKYAELQQKLRGLEAAPQAAKDRTVRLLRDMVAGFTREDLDLLARKVILDDLMWEVASDHQLPFGLTPNTLAVERAKVDAILKAQPDQKVWNAAMRRKVINRKIAEELVEVGVLTSDRIKNPAYFRHQVLDYARAQQRIAASGQKRLRSPKWAKRMGSTLDINANLLEAEFDWLAKALTDIPVARTIEWLKESEHNILDQLRTQGRETNKAGVDAKLQAARDVVDDPNASDDDKGKAQSLLDREQAQRKSIAMGLSSVKGAIKRGELKPPREFQRTAERMSANGRDPQTFAFLSWILDNDAPGAKGAGQVMKAVAERRALHKALLGKAWIDTTDPEALIKALAPDGYTTWQPDEGKLLFTAKTLPEHVLDGMVMKIAETPGLDASDILPALERARTAMVVGGEKYAMILPKEVADTLNALHREDVEGLLDAALAVPMRAWKRWVLINPRRVIKYNLNNLTGDLDVVLAGNPRLLRHTGVAARELAMVARGKAKPTPRYEEAVERGVFDSGLSVQEIPDINRLSAFEALTQERSNRPDKLAMAAAGKAWRGLQGFTQWRENVFRYAAYLDYVERLDAGEDQSSIGYGASVPGMVDAVRDTKDRAALLARDLIGDYGAISDGGAWLRTHMIPFWSWMEINTKRYWRLSKNAYGQGVGRGIATGGGLALAAGVRNSAWLATRMMMVFGAISLWNWLFFDDEEDELSDQQKRQLHIILGRNDSGEIVTLRTQGAASDAISWFGMGDAWAALKNYEAGRGSLGQVLAAPFKAPINKIGTALTPVATVPIEAATGYKLWPDLFNMRVNRDGWRNLFSTVSLENEYDAATGNPSRGYAGSWVDSTVYRREPGEMAYDEARGIAYTWLREVKGQEGSSSFSTPRSEATRDFKKARQFGDQRAEEKAIEEMVSLGMDDGDLAASIKRAAPLGPIPKKDRAAFLASLSDEERAKFEKAQAWYDRTFSD